MKSKNIGRPSEGLKYPLTVHFTKREWDAIQKLANRWNLGYGAAVRRKAGFVK